MINIFILARPAHRMRYNPLEKNSLGGSWQTVQNKSCISVVVLQVFQSYRLSCSPSIGTCRHKALHAFTKCIHRTKMQKIIQYKNGEIPFPLKFVCFRGFASHDVYLCYPNKGIFLRLMFLLYFDNINPVLKRSALNMIRYSHFVLPSVKILS